MKAGATVPSSFFFRCPNAGRTRVIDKIKTNNRINFIFNSCPKNREFNLPDKKKSKMVRSSGKFESSDFIRRNYFHNRIHRSEQHS